MFQKLKIYLTPYNYYHFFKYKKMVKKFKKFGRNFHFDINSTFLTPELITVGDDVFIGGYAHISANLEIGNRVMFGPRPIIIGGSNFFGVKGRSNRFLESQIEEGVIAKTDQDFKFLERVKKEISGKVIVEDDVWCGSLVTILKNVVVGTGAVVGAGSVVTKSLPPYTVCVGNPAKPIKKIFSDENLIEHLVMMNCEMSYATRIMHRRNEELNRFGLFDLDTIDNTSRYYQI